MAKADAFGTISARSARRSATRSWRWVLVAPLLMAAIYFGTRPFFRALARRVAASRSRGVDDPA